MATPSPALAYAYISASINTQKGAINPIFAVKPFILKAFHDPQSKVSTRKEVQAYVADSFGITIPRSVISYIISSMVNSDKTLQVRIGDRRSLDDVQYIATKILAGTDVIAQDKAARETWDSVVGHIAKCKASWDGSLPSAKDIVDEFLDGASLGFVGKNRKAYEVTDGSLEINRFIYHCIEEATTDDFLNSLSELALGDIVYQSIRSATEYEAEFEEAFNRSMKDVDVYLDTRVVLSILGCNGADFEDSALELVDLCQKTNASMKVFEHTIDEIDSIFEAVAGRLNAGVPIEDGVAAFAVENAMEASDLLEFLAGIPDKLRGQSIEILAAPPYDLELGVDEKFLYSSLERDLKQANVDARTRDLQSLTAIFRIRKARAFKFLEKSKAIFVTSNKGLSDVATRFFQDHFRSEGQKNAVQICMTDVVFASRLWVKIPTATRKLPKKQIIVHILGNMRANRSLKESFERKLKALVTSGDINNTEFELVRLSRLTDKLLAMNFSSSSREISEDEAVGVANKVIQEWKRRIAEDTGKSEAIRQEYDAKFKKIEDRLSAVSRESGEKSSQLQETDAEI